MAEADQSGNTVNIINQNAQLNSTATITSGSLSSGNVSLSMIGWRTYRVQAVIHHPTSGGGTSLPFRIGVITTSGTYFAKEGNLNGQWTNEYGGVQQGVLSGNLIGVLTNGTFLVKQGGLSAGWVSEYGGVTLGTLSDVTGSTPLRVGVLTNSGTFLVKEGDLNGQWTNEYGGVQQGVLSGNLIGVLTNGTFLVKQGGLSAGWVNEYPGVTSGTLWSQQ